MKLELDTMFNPNASYRDLVGKAELAWDNEHTALNAIAKLLELTSRYTLQLV